jgi:PadR family transcriptional regulator AphA
MRSGIASFRHLILGLLQQQPMSGYDIKRLLKSLSWLIGNPSSGSLYPALRGLLNDGLVTVELAQHETRRPRKIYSVTEAGRRAFDEWIDEPVRSGAPLRIFLIRLMLADGHSPTSLVSCLERRHAQVASQRRALERTVVGQRGGPRLGQHLAVDYGLALASAELEWLDKALSQLSVST